MSGAGPGDDGFLRRWSRLKSTDAPADPDLSEAQPVVPAETDPAPGAEEEQLDEAAIADLPDIDSLDKDSDYTPFMRDGVPEALRQKALRKLWISDPVFANLDGLNDYDEDFGAIVREGAAFMKRLADAGEKMTRPGSEDDTPAPADDELENEDVADADMSEGETDPSSLDGGDPSDRT